MSRTARWRTARRRAGLSAVVAVVAATCGLAGCGVPHPAMSNGAVTGCYRALPEARTAVHLAGARLLGVHRLSADEVPARVRTLPAVAGDPDTVVCAVAFQGQFVAGQVTGARPTVNGRYAVVLIDAKRLQVLTSYVGDQLPRALRGRLA